MDTWALQKLALKCNHLIETFRGVWSADNFPLMHDDDASPSFQIVNTEASDKPGKHWILLCKRTKSGLGAIIFWDSLGKGPRKYKILSERLHKFKKKKCCVQPSSSEHLFELLWFVLYTCCTVFTNIRKQQSS